LSFAAHESKISLRSGDGPAEKRRIKMSIELSTEERKTRELFENLPEGNHFIMLRSVFKAMYWASLSVEKIEQVACAMHSLETVDLKKALTKLTRAKVLRSRMNSGKRLYEVNY